MNNSKDRQILPPAPFGQAMLFTYPYFVENIMLNWKERQETAA